MTPTSNREPPAEDIVGDGVSTAARLQRALRHEWLPIGAIVFVYVGVCLASLSMRAPLGHDESVYVLRARDLSEGWRHLSGGYWADYRAPGLPTLIWGAELVTPDRPTVARVVVMALGGVVLIATWWLARSMAGRVAAFVAAASLVLVGGFIVSSTMVLADVPGMALSLLAVACLWWELGRRRLVWSLVAVPVLAFAATAVRFGAPFALAGGLGGVALLTLPGLVREKRVRLIAMLVGIGVVTALVGWLVLFTEFLTLAGDSPVHRNSQLIDSKGLTPASGFEDLRHVINPWSRGSNLWSRPAAVLTGIGIAAAWLAALANRAPRKAVVFATCAGLVSAVGVTASVGLVVSNYLMLTLPYWAMLSGIGWAAIASGVQANRSTAVRLAAGVAAGGLLAIQVPAVTTDARAAHRNNSASYGPLVEASREAGDILGEGCLILTSYTPQAGYYSGCWVHPIRRRADAPLADMVAAQVTVARSAGWSGSSEQMAVLTVQGGKRQPSPEQMEASAEIFGERIVEVGTEVDGRRHIWVDRLRPCVLEPSGCR